MVGTCDVYIYNNNIRSSRNSILFAIVYKVKLV